jgi:hypothetical protein
MDCLSELSGGMKMSDLNDANSIQQWMDGFMHDTSLFSNIQQQADRNDIKLLHDQLTHNMINYVERITGGTRRKIRTLKMF